MAVVITLVLNFRRYLRIFKTVDYTQGGVISAYNFVRISLHPLEIQFLKCTINYDTCKFVKVTSIHKEELFKEIWMIFPRSWTELCPLKIARI